MSCCQSPAPVVPLVRTRWAISCSSCYICLQPERFIWAYQRPHWVQSPAGTQHGGKSHLFNMPSGIICIVVPWVGILRSKRDRPSSHGPVGLPLQSYPCSAPSSHGHTEFQGWHKHLGKTLDKEKFKLKRKR